MKNAIKNAAVVRQIPTFVEFTSASTECIRNQFLWKMTHISSSMLMRGMLQRVGVPKPQATKFAIWYENKIRTRFPALKKPIIPQRGSYCSYDTLGRSLKKLWVGYFIKPEALVRAAVVIAKRGECEVIGDCLSRTLVLPPLSHKVRGDIYVNFTQSKKSGELVGVCIDERCGGATKHRVVLSLVNDEVRKSTFGNAHGEWVHAVLDAARCFERPQDRAEWKQDEAPRFGFA